MTDEELAAIRERADAATPGPWNVFRGVIWGRAGSSGPYQLSIAKNANSSSVIEDTGAADRRDRRIEADLGFIAHAREDIPALLAEIDQLHAEVRDGAEALLRTHRILSAKQAENAALCEIVEAVGLVNFGHVYAEFCPFCEKEFHDGEPDQHTPDCPVTKARALLGKSSEEVK
jgi:hypothetical protein